MFFMRLLFVSIMAAAGIAWAQWPEAKPEGKPAAKAAEAQESLTFKASASAVRVDVQVWNGRQPVSGLHDGDFVLREEGVVKTVEYFGREAEPLQVVLLLDVSGSMGKLLREMAEVARQALGTLQVQDQVAVALFSRKARIALELTDEKDLAVRVLKEAPMEHGLGAGTSINEAILSVAEYLKGQPPFAGRRAIVVLTDNGGVHYQVPDEKVVRALSEVNAVFNAIVSPGAKAPAAAGPGANPDFTPANVFRIAEETGGEVLRADKAGVRFQEMLEHIRVRYSLGIKAALAPAGTYRRLEVDLSADARRRYPKAEVRARAGYFTAGE
jgi:VWFA-related protein